MNDKFQTALVLTRVLNTGVIMSIERNERELAALENYVRTQTGMPFVGLFNSATGAIHAALWGQDIVEGDVAYVSDITEQEQRFLTWLGVEGKTPVEHGPSYTKVHIDWENRSIIREDIMRTAGSAPVIVIDFTPLGFGPCAAFATHHEIVWKKAERLKIFGAYDLRTMWTQEESEPNVQPAIQFNYRLSPLVASCVRMSCLGSAV